MMRMKASPMASAPSMHSMSAMTPVLSMPASVKRKKVAAPSSDDEDEECSMETCMAESSVMSFDREEKKSAPPTFKSAAPSRDPYAQMGNLIALQGTQGAFAYSAQLAGAIGLSMSALESALSSLPQLAQISDKEVRQRVWATVLALVYLQKKLSTLAEEWELVDKKARRWLSTQGAQVDQIFAAAQGLIQ